MFAHPWALWFLGLSLPIVALHLYRGRRRRAFVPYLRLWEGVVREEAQRSALAVPRHLVALVLNLLLLSLLCLGLAGPGGAAGPEPESSARSLALVLDATLSMRAREAEGSRFDLARREAERLVEGARGPVRVFCAGRGAEAVVDVGPDREAWRRWLAARRPLGTSGALIPQIEAASEWLRRLGGGQAVVITDGAVRDEPGLAEAVRSASARVVVCGAPQPNLAIVDGRVSRAWGEAGADCFFRVRNFSAEARDVTIVATLDDAPARNFRCALAAEGTEAFSFSLGVDHEARLALRIAADDALPEDNDMRLRAPPLRRTRVFVFQTGGGNPFLVRALSVFGDRLAEGSGFWAPHQWDEVAEALHSDDVVIFDNCGPPDALRPAGYLFFHGRGPYMPASEAHAAEAPGAIAWRRGRLAQGLADMGALRVGRSQVLEVARGQETLIDSDAGSLAASGEGEPAGVRFIALGFRLEDSNFPLLASFPVFLRNALDWLTGEERRHLPASVALGEALAPRRALPAAAGTDGTLRRLGEAADSPEVRDRWGRPLPVAVRGGKFLALGLQDPGFYRFDAGGVSELVAVNFANAGESDLRPIALPGVAASAPPPARRLLPWTAEGILVAAALALLAVEWWLFQRGVI